MFSVPASQAAASCYPKVSPFIAAPSLGERIDEIAKEILKIEAIYPKLMALSKQPEKYREGKVFHSAWLYTVYRDLQGFLNDPVEREEGVALLFSGDGQLVPAPIPDASEAAEIEALIARTDAMPGLFPEAVDVEISRSPEDFFAGFRQEAVKAQLAFERLKDLNDELCEHNIIFKHFKNAVTRIVIGAFEGKIEQLCSELDLVKNALDVLPAEIEALEKKYQHIMEDNAVKVVQVALCVLTEMAESLPPMNPTDVAASSRITHKSQIDQRCAIFYQNRAQVIDCASMLQKRLSDQLAFRNPGRFEGGSATSAGTGTEEDTRSRVVTLGRPILGFISSLA